ncbi:hypothetical protein ONS96_010627 [Cadophora gregata f. sp. sojae]|nr:hypothetical protein ONS96_010627 [Cadophora gregata f. sp. sojae]
MSNITSPSSSPAPGSSMTHRNSRNPFVFDAGDVPIRVSYKGEVRVGKVCSQALIHGSAVWKKFVFPPWNVSRIDHSLPESSKSAVKSCSSTGSFEEINFIEDDGEALLVLMNIIHLKHRLVPRKLQFSTLLQIAVLCEKYMCVQLVQPWLKTWNDNLELRSKYPLAEQVLYTHWVFGQEEEFEKIAKAMVLDVKTSEKGERLNKYKWLWAEPYPPDIVEHIFRIRQQTITNLLAIPYAMVSKYERTNDNICQLGDISGEDNACDAISWGSLTRGMQLAGLWPIKPSEQIYLSVDEVVSAIESIHIYHFHTHTDCGKSNFQQDVARVLRRIESPVMEAHRRHMARQREGVD